MLNINWRVFLCGFSLLLASLSHAQVVTTGEQAVAIDALSHEPSRRTFAKPLPLDNGQTLYFERDGTLPRLWRLDWKTNTATPSLIQNLPLQDDKKRYSAVKTREGIWLVGPVVMLLQADDRQQILPGFDADEPTVVALNDGSVLVLGHGLHDHTEQMRRLSLTPNGIVAKDMGELPHYLSGMDVNYKARYGVAAITLADGRVLTAGGGSSGDTQRTAFVDPLTGAVQPAADMPHKRTYAAMVPLQDGRIVVAGHEHLRCYDTDVRTVDIFEPKKNLWQSLPDLPLPLCSDAYNADGATGTVLPDGTIVLGGDLERHVMVLRPDATSPNGYAAFWDVIAPTDRMRIGGVLQALSNNEIVVAGGVHHAGFGGCCYGTPGADRVSLPAKSSQREQFASVTMPLVGAGVAQRGNRVFIASGRAFSFTSTGQMRYSTLVEMLDISSGLVQQLPPLPFVTGSVQALWLDDDRVLVKGQAVEEGNRGFMPGADLASYIPVSAGAMAVYSVSQQQWSRPIADATLNNASLLYAAGDDAIFLGGNAAIHHVQLSTQHVSTLSSPVAVHAGVTGRRLADGRVVVTGGTLQRMRMSLINDECEMATDNPDRDCPEQFTGWGPMLTANRYQWYVPAADGKGEWHMSEQSAGMQSGTTMDVQQTLVDGEGRVIQLMHPSAGTGDQTLSSWWLERSSNDGKLWQRLPLPADAVATNSNGQAEVCPRACHLILVADPRHPNKEWLFLREGAIEQDGVSEQYDRDTHSGEENTQEKALRVWWLDETGATPQWKHVLDGEGDAMYRKVLPLNAPLTGVQSLGWHLPQPLLWVQQ